MLAGLIILGVGALIVGVSILGSIRGKENYWFLAAIFGATLMFASTPILTEDYIHTDSTTLQYSGDQYEKIRSNAEYEAAGPDDNIWVSNEYLEHLVRYSINSEDGWVRVSGASTAVPYNGGYLLKHGADSAVYVDVIHENSLRSIPLVYENGAFVFYQGDDGKVELDD